MSLFPVLSALLTYPNEALVDALPEIGEALAGHPEAKTLLRPLLRHLAQPDLIELQESYVATFDRNPSHSLHLFEHIHGESRDRGQAMVDLLEEYKNHGFEMTPDELPDYVPLFLEFLGQVDADEAGKLLGDAIHVLAHLGGKLKHNGSPYACVFDVLRGITEVEPRPLAEPPVRDMDEMLETFGPGADGTEPLLKPAASAVQPINFQPRGAMTRPAA